MQQIFTVKTINSIMQDSPRTFKVPALTASAAALIACNRAGCFENEVVSVCDRNGNECEFKQPYED